MRWKNPLQTHYTTLAGFLLAFVGGLAMGILVGRLGFIQTWLYPVPAILIAFFPIVVNVAKGLAAIEPEMKDVLRALGVREMDIMLKVGIPCSMPYFFGLLKIALTPAFVGSVISETVAANSSRGHILPGAHSQFNVPLVFAGVVLAN